MTQLVISTRYGKYFEEIKLYLKLLSQIFHFIKIFHTVWISVVLLYLICKLLSQSLIICKIKKEKKNSLLQ